MAENLNFLDRLLSNKDILEAVEVLKSAQQRDDMENINIAQDRLACLVLVMKYEHDVDNMKEVVGPEVWRRIRTVVGDERADDWDFVSNLLSNGEIIATAEN